MHIVHTLKSDFLDTLGTSLRNKAVVGIVFKVDDTSTLATFFNDWSPSYADDSTKTFDFNMKKTMNGLFDGKGTYYAYEGSLTTPTCDEVVNWYVFPDPLPITSVQLKAINAYFKGDLKFANGNGNNRVIQPLNDRTVKKGNI